MAAQPEILDTGLHKPHRYITDHDNTNKAVFSSAIKEELPQQPVGEVFFGLGYATKEFPISFENGQDISAYAQFLNDKPGMTIKNGTILRMVDMPPSHVSPMHRTLSLDYGVVLDGSVELILDSGETRIMHRGDTSIQRGTNHAWRNLSDKHWARMLYVLIDSQPVVSGGKQLGEDYGEGILGVKASHS